MSAASYSACVTVLNQLVYNGILPAVWLWANAVLLAAALAFSILRGRASREHASRRSLLQREFFNVLWLCTGLAFVVNVCGFNLFSGWSAAAIWSFAETIVLGFIAVHGNRRALMCAIAVVASIVAANFLPPTTAGYALAAGMIAGYTVFGVAEQLAGD